ncbi:hypothetical protein RRG08_058976 [Elysia crispata]|uniref:Uncharacterized protein n=1 Tax=Elysia crispata TaxID=231223 RepID=A0AAE1D3F8_9GAST|nr:hypothetical protein RRG08_058976 [Elysia crispata]
MPSQGVSQRIKPDITDDTQANLAQRRNPNRAAALPSKLAESEHYSKTRCLHGYSALGVQSFTVSRLEILICELIRTAIDLFRVSSPCGGLSLWCEVFMETKDWTQTVPVTGVG